jgi:hypothetical protein
MVDGKNSGISILLIVVAGMASAAVTAFGFFAGAWGGWGGSVAEFTLWFLPAMSFPTSLISLRFRRIGLILSLLILLGTLTAISAINLRSCWNGECSTRNPLLIVFGTLVAAPQIWVPLVVMPLCLYFVCLLQSPNDERLA